jgi:hypothetical protein
MTRLLFGQRLIVVSCLIILLAGMVPAETREVSPRSRSTEFDITFWQTVPLAFFWSSAVASQVSQGGAINWSPVLNCSLLISLANAGWQAGKVGR